MNAMTDCILDEDTTAEITIALMLAGKALESGELSAEQQKEVSAALLSLASTIAKAGISFYESKE
jgi:hypothetical protein